MCESVELARILDVSGSLLKTTCRQNSAIANLSAMAKIRLSDKTDSKPALLQSEHVGEKRSSFVSSAAVKMSSSVDNSSSSSYSSSLESQGSTKFPGNDERTYDEIEKMINGVKGIKIFKRANIVDDENDSDNEPESVKNRIGKNLNFVYARNIVASDVEKSEKLFDEDDDENVEDEDDDEGLIERGPVRPQLNPINRSKPYVESSQHWSNSGVAQQSENSTDFDTSAKAILTDREYREKIDFCLDKLSDMRQERSPVTDSLSPTYSDFGGTMSGYSPPQQQHQWQPDRSPPASKTNGSPLCFVPSITVCDSESSLLEILSRGGFQAAQSSQTPEYNSTGSAACASDNWPDSPASSYNNCATSASRPDSRASSRAQSPGSNNGYGGVSFLNVLCSPMGSPQVSSQNFRNLQRPSSSSSSSQSYCETPSPANYQNPLDQHLEEQLGDNIMTRLPVWRDSFESSNTLVNSVDSNELHLQLVEEVIRGDMNNQVKDNPANDMQVVPNCKAFTSSNCTNSYSMANSNQMTSSGATSCMDNAETTDELTNTLLRFVGSEQAIISHRKVEARNIPTTSAYNNSNGGNEVRKACDGDCLQMEQSLKNNFSGNTRNLTKQQPQQSSTVYQQQCMNFNSSMNAENLQFSTTTAELMGRNSWQNYSESQSMMGNSSSSNNFVEFQIPETVTSYNSQRSKSSSKCSAPFKSSVGGERSIAPWPSLNLPSTRASERLKEVTDPREVERAMKNLLKKPHDQLAKGDEDGDTMLMCLAGNPLELRKKLAYLAPLVERLGTIDGALSMLNSRGEDALYLAAMNCPHMAFVAGYLAAAFLQKNIDIGQRLYRSRGDTLVHALAAKGDRHGEVLAELLSLKTAQGNSVFDLSKRNYDGRTALHVAAEAHDSLGKNSRTVTIATTRLLLENNADPMIREVRCGDTALHLAVSLNCDPSLVKALLTGRGREAVNVANYNGNTPLHMAAMISERTSLERQSEVCWHLIQAGGKTNLTNRQGKTPLALVSADRKEALRRIFHKKTY